MGETLRDRFLAFRAATIGRAGFRRWAARFPLTRPVARAATRDLFDLTAGFVYSQVLAACVQLEVFGLLAAGPATTGSIAAAAGLSPDAALTLLRAAESLRLVVQRDDGRWGLADLGAVVAQDAGIRAMVAHHAMLYRDLADPVALLRAPRGGGELARFWAYARAAAPGALPGSDVHHYSLLMAASQSFIAEEVLDAVDLSGVGTLLDVGGGEGAFLLAAAARHPTLKLRLFDLPAVAARAESRFADAGLAGRAAVTGGDFLHDPLPQGADMISLVRVIHDHDDDSAARLLRNVRKALPPGGRLLLAEPMAGTRGAEPAGSAYFGLYLHAMGSGRPRTQAELTAMLRKAGFGPPRGRRSATPLLVRVLVAPAD